jgi:hypothetical protein
MHALTSDSEDELVGPVSTVDVESAPLLLIDGRVVEGKRIPSLKVRYDPEGRKLEELNYDDRGVLVRKNLSTYGEAGELEQVRAYASDGSLVSRRVYSRDVDTDTVAELTYNGQETSEVQKTIYSFDTGGKMVSQTILPSTDQPSLQMLMIYDDRDRLLEVSICMGNTDSLVVVPGVGGESIMLSGELKDKLKRAGPCGDGLLTSRTTFTRDSAGHLSEAATYNGEGVLVSREAYAREYDSNGNWIKQTLSKWKPESAEFLPIKMSYRKIIYN